MIPKVVEVFLLTLFALWGQSHFLPSGRWMGWMVIIGHRSSKSTFGANKVRQKCPNSKGRALTNWVGGLSNLKKNIKLIFCGGSGHPNIMKPLNMVNHS